MSGWTGRWMDEHMIKKPYGLHAMLCKSHYEVQRILNEGECSIVVIENFELMVLRALEEG